MPNKFTLEIIFLLLVIALSLTGFSGLYFGGHAAPSAYHHLHVITTFAWLALLLSQLVLIRRRRFQRHRAIGTSVFVAGPVLVASLTLLTVHSAAKDAVAGEADFMVVQNVMVTLEVALLVFLAFILRKNRNVHGALLLSTALLFMGIALFFTLIGFAPQFRIEGPETFHRFAQAGQAAAYVVGALGLLMFLKNRRSGWPWILAASLFFLNGLLQVVVERSDGTLALTLLVASIGRAPAFCLGLVIFVGLLWVAWRVDASNQSLHGMVDAAPSKG